MPYALDNRGGKRLQVVGTYDADAWERADVVEGGVDAAELPYVLWGELGQGLLTDEANRSTGGDVLTDREVVGVQSTSGVAGALVTPPITPA